MDSEQDMSIGHSIGYFNYNDSNSSNSNSDFDDILYKTNNNENNGDNGINKEDSNNEENLKDKDIKNEIEYKSKLLLGRKHLINFEDEDELKNNSLEQSKDNSIDILHIDPEKIVKAISDNNMKDDDNLINLEDQQNLNSTKSETNDKNYRANQKDNFPIKLFKKINDLMKEKIKLASNIKLKNPKYDIFTHNTNLVYIFFYLDLKYKYILSFTPKDKKALDKLLCKLKLKKDYKKKETTLNDKEIKKAKKLFKFYGYEIDENEKKNYKYYIIDFLNTIGLKKSNDNILYKSDKEIIDELLIKNELSKEHNFQKKNEEEINKIENEIELKEVRQLLNKTLREIIIDFYNSKEFYNFSKEVQNIDKSYQRSKKYKYSLLDKENNGFIRMVEDDCALQPEKKDKIRKLIAYFNEEGLNAEKIEEYEKNVLPKDKEMSI